MEDEVVIMNIILHSGDARSKAFEAISAAEEHDFDQAHALIKESEQQLNKGHLTQTKLIQDEINGEAVKTSLLMVHAQDHLMNAITVKELAVKMIRMYQNCKGG